MVGPIGSGKSSACVLELLRRSVEQKPGPDGVRRSRWAVVRNTYGQLRDTTRKTFEQWIPAELGRWHERDFMFELKFNDVHSEILFRALDRPGDVRKLLSLELTGAYINEVRELPKAILDGLQMRCKRFPSKIQGGFTWSGIWGDSNPWHARHWADLLFRQKLPSHRLFRQPGGRAPNAENLENLDPRYYLDLVAGKDSEWIKMYIDGEDAASVVGSIWGDAVDALEKSGGIKEFDHPRDDIFTSWDLGRSDSTSIWFWRVAGPGMVEVIDHYENHLKPLSHYFEIVDQRGYKYIKHWLPHDAAAKTLASELSVEDQCREHWPNKVQIGPSLSVQDGIHAARWLLEKHVRFHARCATNGSEDESSGVDSLKAYRRAWDDRLQTYSSEPVHDWASHTADAFRYMAVVTKVTELITRKPQAKVAPVVKPLAQAFQLDDFDAQEKGDDRI